MTVRNALRKAQDLFRQHGYETPYLDAVVLLAACMGTDKARILAAYPDVLSKGVEDCYQDAVQRRLSGLPVSYILKRKEFYGLPFYVDDRVLVPRPETEILVERALQILQEDPSVFRIHDACTGTGCIPISMLDQIHRMNLAREVEVSASDISESALEVFRINCHRVLGFSIPHTVSDLLVEVEGPLDMITANPPYISKEEVDRMMAAQWPEPRLALDGGMEGLELILPLARQAMERLAEKGYLLLEGADSQADAILDTLNSLGYKSVETLQDLAGKRRVVIGRKG